MKMTWTQAEKMQFLSGKTNKLVKDDHCGYNLTTNCQCFVFKVQHKAFIIVLCEWKLPSPLKKKKEEL